ncbi:PAS domain S-box protein [Chloroflexota bacterium]
MSPQFNILIVDDDAALSANLRDILDAEGYGVAIAGNGREALAICRQRDFAITFSDINLPDMRGVHLVEKLVELYPVMEFIMITGYASLDTAVEAVKQRNIIAYETKPLDLGSLLALTRQVAERKRMEAALIMSEARYRDIVENAATGVVITDLNGIIVYFNKALAHMVGYDGEEMLGRPFVSFIYPGDRRKIKSKFRRLTGNLAGRNELEFRAMHKDGRFVYMRSSPTALKRNEEVTGFSSIITDITQRQRAEYDLNKRIKEMSCLYAVTNVAEKYDFPSDELFGEVVTLLPKGWQYPANACAMIRIGGREFTTENWRETEWKLSSDINLSGVGVGSVEIGYLEEKPGADEGPFLKEERLLLNAVAERLEVIAGRKRASEALQHERDTAQSYLDVAGVILVVLDADEKVRLVNKRGCEVLGYDDSEIVGRNWFDCFVPPDISGKIQEVYRKLIAGEVEPVEYYENAVMTASGEEKIIAWHNTVLRDEKGDITGALSSGEDVTERIAAEELLMTIARNSPIGIYIVQDSKFRYVNPQMEKSLGYPEKELIGTESLKYVYPDDRDIVRARAIMMLKEERPYPYEYRIIDKSGEIRWVMETVTSIQYRGRQATLGNYLDTTERKQVEKKIIEYEELNKLKTDLLSTVSHELRTPLATIKGYSTMLLDYDGKLEAGEKRENLEAIDRATDRLIELVERLLDMSRMDAGLLKLDKSPADIMELIKSVVTEGRLRFPRHDIVAANNNNGNLSRVSVDARRMRQVLDNLIDNACKYSEEATQVVVAATRTNSQLVIGITDSGIGIAENEVDRVFDRMYRIEQRLSVRYGGMGLGLAICRGLVEAHGGRIWMVSEEGKGSTCSFSLPLQEGG